MEKMSGDVDLTEFLESDDVEGLESEGEESEETETKETETKKGSDETLEEEEELETDEGEEEEEQVEPDTKQKKAGELEAEKVGRQLQKEVQDILAQMDKDEILKSKGLEVKLSDFKPEEIKGFLNKGLRFYQAMDELSKMEATYQQREASLQRAALQIQDLQNQLDRKLKSVALQKETTMPKNYEIDKENDTPDVVALKEALQAQWKHNQSLAERLDSIEGGFEQQRTQSQDVALMNEIKSHQTDFPLASPEETLAVHILSGGRIPIRQIMQKGETIYGNANFVRKVFKTHPEVRKEISDEITKEYLAKANSASKKRVPVKPAGTGMKTVPVKKPTKALTFDNVGSALKRHLKTVSEELEEEV
jgi:hypothetical protein